ncbi:MAG: ATP-binding protein, partial [Acidobacteriota bacterium]
TATQLMRLRTGSDAHDRERVVIERQVKHMIRLVDDLLDVSRITRGKVELRKAPVELARVIAQAIEATSALVEDRGQRLTLEVPGTGLVVDGDFDRLAQVIGNLVVNSAKYTPRGGRIAISAQREGADACVRVSDSGIGLPAELLPHVFEMFVQGERTRDRAEGGLGLGLAIVKNLVELHGGHVTAASDGPGKGAVISVWLPLAARAAATTGAGSAQAQDAAWPLRILVVDDNVDAAELLAELLRSMGYETDVAHDAGGALEAARQRPPDVALLDIGLPAVDGYELARRMRALPALATTPLVAITGYGQQGDRARSEAAGFAAHLVKPIGSRELRAVLEQARH